MAICSCGNHAFTSGSRGGIILVSTADAELLDQKWQEHPKGYAHNRSGRLHRLVMGEPDGLFVDHINRDTLDCRRENLRTATPAESVRNRGKLRGRKSPASKYIGVHRNGERWIARITIDGVRRSVGTFPTPKEAAQAYDAAAKTHVGEFASLNFGR